MVLLPQKWSHNRHSPQAKRKLHNKSKRDAHDLTPQGGRCAIIAAYSTSMMKSSSARTYIVK